MSFEAWKDEVITAAGKIDAATDKTSDEVLRALYAEVVKMSAENRGLHERTRGLVWFCLTVLVGVLGYLWRTGT